MAKEDGVENEIGFRDAFQGDNEAAFLDPEGFDMLGGPIANLVNIKDLGGGDPGDLLSSPPDKTKTSMCCW